MVTNTDTWTEEIVEVAGTRVQIVKGGSGEPLFLLHGEMGHPGWLRFHEALAQNHTLYIPSHPGFGKSERLSWIMTMRDLAGWYLQALDDLALGQVNVIGFSFGGWLAAEMATMSPGQFKKLVLVGAAGIKPPVGEIFDMFLVVAKEYLAACLLDPANTQEFERISPAEPTPDQVEAWEVAREEACRLSWKPYMYDPALPHLLRRLKTLPTLITWGRQDPIIPLSAAEVYHESIQGSRLVVLDNCGHQPEIEKPDEFIGVVHPFLSRD
ncbi:MAG: alpha/beta hydrolase [Candidatus Tectomicrobia bacterium]|nr:alpha/beta hydrolase [Candidatus Tectomicrobia bacterium]